MLSREMLATMCTFVAATALCWCGKIDGTAWVAAATLSTGVLTAGRCAVKAVRGEA